MRISAMIYVLVAIWAVVFAGSILLALNIDGPRNLDTGFKRLDMLVKGQVLASVLAVVSAVIVLMMRGLRRRDKWVGLAPAISTVLLVIGVILTTLLMNYRTPPDSSVPTRPTTEVPTAPADG